MSTHKNIDRICCVVIALALVLTVAFMNGERLGGGGCRLWRRIRKAPL